MSKLCQGRIVWTVVADRNGVCKKHPVVILTRTDEIVSSDELIGVVASHTAYLQQPRPHTYVELPHQPDGRVGTLLKKGTVAVCTWLAPVKKSDLTAECIGGLVSPITLEPVVQKVREVFGAKQPIYLDD